LLLVKLLLLLLVQSWKTVWICKEKQLRVVLLNQLLEFVAVAIDSRPRNVRQKEAKESRWIKLFGVDAIAVLALTKKEQMNFEQTRAKITSRGNLKLSQLSASTKCCAAPSPWKIDKAFEMVKTFVG
jgi:hypothetical protein